jgi:hypothetical protein
MSDVVGKNQGHARPRGPLQPLIAGPHNNGCRRSREGFIIDIQVRKRFEVLSSDFGWTLRHENLDFREFISRHLKSWQIVARKPRALMVRI